ncbi:MAG: site-2 protease family protein [Clostridia bacterium]|nr:site-2 protease family protein [Clostridia bacterium]
MKKQTKTLLINLSAVFLWLVIAILLIARLILTAKNAWLYCLIALVLIPINYALSLLVHETGHVVFAAANGFKCKTVNFGLFTLDLTSGFKLSFFTFMAEDGGESLFVPTKTVTKKQLKLLAFGGLAFSFIYLLAVGLLSLAFAKEVTTVMLCGLTVAGYLLTVNALPFDKTSDGAMLINKDGYVDGLCYAQNCQLAIENGLVPEQNSIEKCKNQPICVYFDYLLAVYNQNFAKAEQTVKLLYERVEDFSYDEYYLLLPEIIYWATIKNALTEGLERRAKHLFESNLNSSAFLRAHYAYRLLKGEREWATTIKNSYDATLSKAPAFYAECESKLISQLCKG